MYLYLQLRSVSTDLNAYCLSMIFFSIKNYYIKYHYIYTNSVLVCEVWTVKPFPSFQFFFPICLLCKANIRVLYFSHLIILVFYLNIYSIIFCVIIDIYVLQFTSTITVVIYFINSQSFCIEYSVLFVPLISLAIPFYNEFCWELRW